MRNVGARKHVALTSDSYDGEADEPAPPTKAEPETRHEPEAAPAPDITEPVQEQQEEDVTFKTEPDQPMQEAAQQTAPSHDDDYDKPLQIKEDG